MVPTQERFAPKYLLYTGFLCLSFNAGMWLFSTKWLKKRKILLSVLHIPSVLYSLSLVAEFGFIVYLGITIAICCYGLLYRYGGSDCEIS
jgi:hypothetical protein